MVLHLSRGELIDQRASSGAWRKCSTARNDMELRRGTYRVRGDIIDIFPGDEEPRLCASSCSMRKSKASLSRPADR